MKQGLTTQLLVGEQDQGIEFGRGKRRKLKVRTHGDDGKDIGMLSNVADTSLLQMSRQVRDNRMEGASTSMIGLEVSSANNPAVVVKEDITNNEYHRKFLRVRICATEYLLTRVFQS